MEITLTEKELNQLIDYLIEKPWKEANPLIILLEQARQRGEKNANIQKI